MKEFSNWATVPQNLKTRTALKQMGLRPRRNQKPVATKTHWYWKIPDYDLYEVGDCIPYKLSEKQLAVLEKARQKSLEARTCKGCAYVQQLGRHYRKKWYVSGGFCPNCRERQERESERQGAIEWARGILQRDDVLILDTETTDFEGEVIELVVIDLKGQAVYNHRFKPVSEIAPDAAATHGLTAEILAHEASFASEYEAIKTLLQSAGLVLIYNAAFDHYRIQYTSELHDLEPFTFKRDCLMEWYAVYVNRWSYWHKSYTWQPLNGDHSALGDCRAALGVLNEMAQEANTTELQV